MTIINVTEDWRPYEATDTITDGITGTRAFLVQSDDPTELIGNVITSIPVVRGQLLPGTLISICTELHAALREPDNDRLNWRVTCSYKSLLNQIEQQRIDNPNPLDRTPRISWTARTVMQAQTSMQCALGPGPAKAYTTWDSSTFTFATATPVSISNAASDPFDPPLERPTTEWIANVTVNVTTPPTWVLTYNESVNNADVVIDGLTLLKGCGKTENLRVGEIQVENGTAYRQLTYSVVCRKPRAARSGETSVPEPWDIEVLNEGMRTYNASHKWQNITDSSGQAVSKPVPLNASGVPIDPSGAPIPESSLTWILFRPNERKDFTVLPGITAP